MKPCALLHRSMEVGSREWPNRKAAAENDASMLGLTLGSYPFQ